MQESDLPEVERLDHAAFSPPWQMDSEALKETWKQSILATILRREGQIAGYLMASHTAHGVHLTRVAVHPREQNKGLGRILITHLLNSFHHQGAPRITVNTQIENRRSQRPGICRNGRIVSCFPDRFAYPPTVIPRDRLTEQHAPRR
jgi:ribosomal-protein-alanine N-acetyltransferase